jgi:hypothetical protein
VKAWPPKIYPCPTAKHGRTQISSPCQSPRPPLLLSLRLSVLLWTSPPRPRVQRAAAHACCSSARPTCRGAARPAADPALIYKSFSEAPAPSSSRQRSGAAVGARRGMDLGPLRTDELRPPSPLLTGGVALWSARAAPATPFLSSGAVTLRCCSRRTGLWSSPSGGPDAWVEVQKDGKMTHVCVARRHQPKMCRSFV